jgi:hypothetical protein
MCIPHWMPAGVYPKPFVKLKTGSVEGPECDAATFVIPGKAAGRDPESRILLCTRRNDSLSLVQSA